MGNPSPADGCAMGCAGLMMVGVGLLIMLVFFGGCAVML